MKVKGDFFVSQGPPKMEQIVDLTSLKKAKEKFNKNIEKKRGNIVLLVGQRGIGKSTTLTYLKNHVDKEKGPDFSRIIDLGLHFTELLDKNYNDRTTFILKIIAKELSNESTDDIRNVLKALDDSDNGPYFLFIDNFDRLYQSQDDLNYVNYFFRTADPIIKKISEKIVTVISCAPEWESFLKDRDLSYINFTNRIKLEPLSKEEIKNLIDYRVKAENHSVIDVVDEELIPVLSVASRGNPRSMFQFLERVSDETGMPISVHSFQRVVGSELFQGANEELSKIASKSPNIAWGVNQTWRYFDALQKNGIDTKVGIEKLIKAHKYGMISESDIKNMKGAFFKISHNSSKKSVYELNSPVRNMLTEWYQKTKIDKSILLTAYSETPFTLSATNVDAYIDEYQDALVDLHEPSKIFRRSYEQYISITSQYYAEDRIKLVNNGWECIKNLMLSIISICEKGIPKSLYDQLSNSKEEDKASKLLINEITNIYVTLDKSNPYKSDIESIKARYMDVKESPKVVEYWDTNQLQNFIQQVKKSYEGLIRTLKPSMILDSRKGKEVISVLNIINKEENNEIEMKSALIWDQYKEMKNKNLEIASLKSIVAFLNTSGGVLIIGVDDNKKILGIEGDILTLNRKNAYDIDGYEQHLRNLIDSYIGSHIGIYIKLSFPRVKGNIICVVKVEESPYTVYLKENDKKTFYVRSGNSTRELGGHELEKYIQHHYS